MLLVDWDTCELPEDAELDAVSRCVLAVLLKHCNMLKMVSSLKNMKL